MLEIIINPSGGSGAAKKLFEKKIKPLLDQRHAEYRLHYSTLARDLDTICHDITGDGKEHTLVIVGGDGSMNVAVNGIQHFDKNKVGFIPAGSGNDLALALKISRDPEELVNAILKGEVKRELDIIEISVDGMYDRDNAKISSKTFTRKANISSGFGFDAEICAEAEGVKLKNVLNKLGLGKLIYLAVALKVIFTTKMVPAYAVIDGKRTELYDLLFTAAMNTAYEGGGFKFCPDAIGTDGVLNIVSGNGLSRFDFFRIFPYAYSGAHVKFDGVSIHTFSQCDVYSEVPLWVHTDGEVVGKTRHVSYRLADAKLRMIV